MRDEKGTEQEGRIENQKEKVMKNKNQENTSQRKAKKKKKVYIIQEGRRNALMPSCGGKS